MNRFLFISLMVVLFFPSYGIAQKGTIKGQVMDRETGEEIIGANVIIEGTVTGASTDIYGNFEFNADPGNYNIVVSYIGYQAFKITDLQVNPNEDIILTIQMQTDNVQLKAQIILIQCVSW